MYVLDCPAVSHLVFVAPYPHSMWLISAEPPSTDNRSFHLTLCFTSAYSSSPGSVLFV